jgi:predicted CopG family antitoxin
VGNVTTIPIEKEVLKELKEVKQYPRQTYSELLTEMTKVFKLLKPQKTSYDELLHKIQQNKMKELWDNKEDKLWQKQSQELAVKRGWSEAHELFEF